VKQDKINVNTCWRFDFEHHKAQAAQLRMLACGFDPKVKKTSRPNPRLATKKTYRVRLTQHVERREVSTIEAVSLEKAREIASNMLRARSEIARLSDGGWWALDWVDKAIETTETKIGE